MQAKIWSVGKNAFVEIATTTEQQAKIEAFIEEYKDGEFFSASDVDDLFTKDQLTEADTDTAAMLAAFLPAEDNLGVCQHGTDDFAIEETD